MANLDTLAGLQGTSFFKKVEQALREEAKGIIDAEIATPGSQDANQLSYSKKIFNGSIDSINFLKNLSTVPLIKNLDNPFTDATDSNIRNAIGVIFGVAAYASES